MKEFLSNPIVHGVIILTLAYLASKIFFKADKRIEGRRRKAIDLSAALKANGMTWVPDLLIDYAVGDYENVGVKLGHIGVDIAKDPNLKAEFDTVFQKLLASKFQDADAKKELESLLEGLGHKLTPISPAPDMLTQLKDHITDAVNAAVPVPPVVK
jgi:hypothetical protein